MRFATWAGILSTHQRREIYQKHMVKSMIVNTTRITIRPENRNEFFQTIRPLLDPIRHEKGCLAYRFFVDATDENTSLLLGEWQSREDWSNHLRSRDFAILLGALTVLGSPAGIEFRLLSSVDSEEQSSKFWELS
jgi:quinol monooxygenase YgiN